MAELTSSFDTSIDIITPENIAFKYRVAGPFQRVLAYAIDVCIRMAILIVAAILIGCFGFMITSVLGAGPILLLSFVLAWFYGGLFEALWNGQTPGKRVFHLRVICKDGQPISGTQAVMRNLLRYVDLLPMAVTLNMLIDIVWPLPIYTAWLGLLAMAANSRYQRMGDLVAGTIVVVEEPQRLYGVMRITEPEALRLAGEIPAGFQVSRSLALALSNYVQRRLGFAWPRRREIAAHLAEPLRDKFGLPPGTDYDMLLCGLYHKTFIQEQAPGEGENPFSEQFQIVT